MTNIVGDTIQMSANPYAAPSAPVAELQETKSGNEPPFFAVSPTKLLVLTACTFGLYQVYWFYRHWRRIKERDREDISPVWRSLFGIFFCHSLFARIRDEQVKENQGKLPAGLLAAVWILASIAWRLPDPYFLVGMCAWVCPVPVQSAANRVNTSLQPEHDRNARFGIANWITVAVGGVFFLLVMIGTFMPGTTD